MNGHCDGESIPWHITIEKAISSFFYQNPKYFFFFKSFHQTQLPMCVRVGAIALNVFHLKRFPIGGLHLRNNRIQNNW